MKCGYLNSCKSIRINPNYDRNNLNALRECKPTLTQLKFPLFHLCQLFLFLPESAMVAFLNKVENKSINGINQKYKRHYSENNY